MGTNCIICSTKLISATDLATKNPNIHLDSKLIKVESIEKECFGCEEILMINH